MTGAIQIVAIGISTLLLLLVLELVRRRRLSEEYSFIWIVCAGALLLLAVARRSVDELALWLGIYYPPALLILVLFLFVFVASLYFSLVISQQREQIERLIEEVAILSALVGENTARLRSLRHESVKRASNDVTPPSEGSSSTGSPERLRSGRPSGAPSAPSRHTPGSA